jgi:hypothetical protein
MFVIRDGGGSFPGGRARLLGVDSLTLLVEIIAVVSCDPINDRPSKAGEFLRLNGAFVDSTNLQAVFELEDFVMVAFARIKLDDNFVAFRLLVKAKGIILLKHCGRHQQLNNHRP